MRIFRRDCKSPSYFLPGSHKAVTVINIISKNPKYACGSRITVTVSKPKIANSPLAMWQRVETTRSRPALRLKAMFRNPMQIITSPALAK
jgi:hypothetical protein